MTTYASIPTGMTAAELDAMFAAVAANGESQKQKMMANAVPADLQPHWQEYYEQSTAPPVIPPTQATVNNGDTINVQMWDASTVPGAATVAGNALTRVTPQVVASKAIIANGGSVVVHDAADAVQAGSPGAATVAAGVFTKVNLTV